MAGGYAAGARMTTANSVADLAALLAEPSRVTELDPEAARALLSQVSALAFALAVRAATTPPAPSPGGGDGSRNGHPEPAVWLSASQVEAVYGLTAAWLSEHSRELDRVPGLVTKPSRKVRLYRAATLRRWLEARTVA